MKAILAAVLIVFATSASATRYGDTDIDYNYNWNYPQASASGGNGGSATVDNDVRNTNFNTNRSASNSDATGVGVGISGAQATGGQSAADASVGDVTVGGANVHSSNRNTVQGGRNYQTQSQTQRQSNSNGATGSGNSTSVVVEGDTYKAPKKPDVPAYAPNVITSPATAPCYVTAGASGGLAGTFAIGGSWYKKDHGCALGEVARRASTMGNDAIANEALELMFATVKREAGLAKEKEEAIADVTYVHPSEDVFWFNK